MAREHFEQGMADHDYFNGPAGEHEHQWGPLEQSRMAGTVHRKCSVDGCKHVNAYDGDDD